MWEVLVKVSYKVYLSVFLLLLSFCLVSSCLMIFFPAINNLDNYRFIILTIGVLSLPIFLISILNLQNTQESVQYHWYKGEIADPEGQKLKEAEEKIFTLQFWLISSSVYILGITSLWFIALLIDYVSECFILKDYIDAYFTLLFLSFAFCLFLILDTRRLKKLMKKRSQSLESLSDLPSDTLPQPPSHTQS